MRVVLIHGGIWEDMTAEKMWHAPGITAALTAAGLRVDTPQRLTHPVSWDADVAHLLPQLPSEPFVLIGASNGCTATVRIATNLGEQVTKVGLIWPATCGDTERDARFAAALTAQGADPGTIADLIGGQTLRGVTDAQIQNLRRCQVGVVAAPPQSPFHRRHTVDRLLELIGGARELGEFPESPRPDFPGVRREFIDALTQWIAPA